MIVFLDFLNLFNGTSADFDNYYGDQCVDLVQFWSRAIGGPRFTGNAQDLVNQAGSFYEWIVNTPTAVPKQGDIVVWSNKFNGTVGHVGIATGEGNTNTFTCFEQNDPGPGICHIKNYTYFAVLGWLHPKQLPQDQQNIINQLRMERDKNWGLYQADEEKLKALRQQFDAYIATHPATMFNKPMDTSGSGAANITVPKPIIQPLEKPQPSFLQWFFDLFK